MKKYVAQVSYFVYADNDEDAIKQARELCKKQEEQNDDGCSLDKMVEVVSFFQTREVELKSINRHQF